MPTECRCLLNIFFFAASTLLLCLSGLSMVWFYSTQWYNPLPSRGTLIVWLKTRLCHKSKTQPTTTSGDHLLLLGSAGDTWVKIFVYDARAEAVTVTVIANSTLVMQEDERHRYVFVIFSGFSRFSFPNNKKSRGRACHDS